MLWPSSPTPNSAPSRPTPSCVPIWRDMRSRACSRSAWAISWPITAAISSSVAFSFWIRPVYIAILPAGMHQAFTSSIEITCTSHGHLAASGRNTVVCGISRLVMSRTRFTMAGSLSSTPFFCASAIICA